MAQPRRTIDPDAGPVERFAHELRGFRERAGNPDYRSMARRAHCAPSTLSTAAGGSRLPTLETTLAFVRACGASEAAAAEWARAWETARADTAAESKPGPSTPATPEPAEQPATAPATTPARRWTFLAGLASGLAIAALTGAVLVLTGVLRTPSAATGQQQVSAVANPPVVDDAPVRRHATLVLGPNQVADLDSTGPGWAITPAPGADDTDIWFDSDDALVAGAHKAALAVLPPGTATGYTPCATEHRYGVDLTGAALAPGTLSCDITSDRHVVELRVTAVHRRADGAPDQVTFDVTSWQPIHQV